jgi:hypothetical protein
MILTTPSPRALLVGAEHARPDCSMKLDCLSSRRVVDRHREALTGTRPAVRKLVAYRSSSR